MSTELLPPAQPDFILRGHSAQIHATHFTQGNSRLLTADADGWIVSWNLAIKRPTAAWKGHSNAILAIGTWGKDRVITYVTILYHNLYFDVFNLIYKATRHGRDHKLLVWQLGAEEEAVLEKVLPIDNVADSPKQPWLLHALPVNTLNFCAFAMCRDGMPQGLGMQKTLKDANLPDPVLIAVPNTVDSGAVSLFFAE